MNGERRPAGYALVETRTAPLGQGFSYEEEVNVDEQSDDEREAERKKERWDRRRRNTELIYAVLDAKHDEVRRLLERGVSPLVRCQHSMATVSHLAALMGEDDILQTLARRGVDSGEGKAALLARDRLGRQPHHLAAAAGRLSTLRLVLQLEPALVDSRVQIPAQENFPEAHLDSFLHDHLEVTHLLPNITEGSTALHLAAKHSFIDMVDFLLEQNAEVNIKDCNGLSPLDVAGIYADPTIPGTIVGAAVPACYSPESREGSILLDPAQATDATPMVPFSLPMEPDETDATMVRPMGISYQVRPESPAVKLNVPARNISATVTKLINRGGVLSEDRSASLTTPLHRAVERVPFDPAAVEEILRMQGVSPIRIRDGQGRTAVHLAAQLNLLEPLRLLLDRDPEVVNRTDREGRTPLHVAVEHGWGQAIELLLNQREVSLRAQTNDGETVLHIAAKKKKPDIVRSLLTRTSNSVINQRDRRGYTALFRAIQNKDVQTVELFLDACRPRKYTVNERDTIAHIAVKANAVNVLRVLDMRSQLSYNVANQAGSSALHTAVEMNAKECLSFMMEAGRGDLSLQRTRGGTPLHIAAELGHVEALKMILDRISRERLWGLVVAGDLERREPLVLAAQNGHIDCVVLLLRHGANLAASNGSLTALELIDYNVPNTARVMDDLLDGFMTVVHPEERDDSPRIEVKLDYKCLLADCREDQRQLGVVEAFIKCRHDRLRKTLFLHPLTESFLHFKWQLLKSYFLILVLVFMTHLVALTGYSLCTFVYPEDMICKSTWPFGFNLVVWITRCNVIIFLIPLIVLEVMLFRLDLSYLMDLESWLKWLVVVTSFVTVIVAPSTYWARSLAAVSVLLAWGSLLFLVARGLQRWGLHVLMFLEVANNVWQVISRFGFLLLGFAFSFLILFRDAHPYEGLGDTLSKVLVMMVELDYAGSYGSSEDKDPIVRWEHHLVGRVLYLFFVIYVVMVLNNLINGLCVSDVAELEKQGRTRRVEKQASFLVLFEKMCHWPIGKLDPRPAPDITTIFPNRNRGVDNPLPKELRKRILLAIRNRDEISDQQRMESIAEDVKELREAVKDIKSSLRNILPPERRF